MLPQHRMAVTDCRRVITTGRRDLGNEMSGDDFTTMSDPEFLAERRRVREALADMPTHEVSVALADRYHQLNEEFLRRARAMWGGGE